MKGRKKNTSRKLKQGINYTLELVFQGVSGLEIENDNNCQNIRAQENSSPFTPKSCFFKKRDENISFEIYKYKILSFTQKKRGSEKAKILPRPGKGAFL